MLIQLKDLTKTINRKNIVELVNLEIAAGLIARN